MGKPQRTTSAANSEITYGIPKKSPVRIKPVMTLINRLDVAQRTLADMDSAPEAARSAVLAEIDKINEQLALSAAQAAKDKAEATEYRKSIQRKKASDQGFDVDDNGNVRLP